MTASYFTTARTCALATLLGAALAGCAGLGTPNASGESYCYRVHPAPDKAQFRTCTSGPIPPRAVDAEAKRFEPLTGAATLYVVRRSWGDRSNRIEISVDDRAMLETIPRSFARLRLSEGEHALSFVWNGTRHTQPLHLRAGEVSFVELNATGWIGGLQYGWDASQGTLARDEARGATLVADLDLR